MTGKIVDFGTHRLMRDIATAAESGSHFCDKKKHKPTVIRGVPTPCCEPCPSKKCGPRGIKHGHLNAHLREDHG